VKEIVALKPDLVVVSKEENLKSHVDKMVEAGLKVHVTDIGTVEQGLDQLQEMFAVMGVEKVRPLVGSGGSSADEVFGCSGSGDDDDDDDDSGK